MMGSIIGWMTPHDQFSMLQCGHRVHPDAVAFKVSPRIQFWRWKLSGHSSEFCWQSLSRPTTALMVSLSLALVATPYRDSQIKIKITIELVPLHWN